ncbi:kinesin-like protein KIF3A isoform X2 [Histomonas meleagridis]|uniref:kinesin-like protein KIF3A isoform X2 n=1 Tax=Histomonas meleagridis TaxID=135588 RepID=UPI00355ACDA5|nr:kinesin-like protein KIF3A isoform X2 [Histomonas meleagridis]KAH0802679.1 kinesin-like protein KIF3A isoform X2 [Histomonas meleagridis]
MSSENIKVVVRCRPLSQKEINNKCVEDITMNVPASTVYLQKKPGDPNPKSFVFNSVFPNNATQKDIYDIAARPIVESVLEGYNGTIFAYGQTGTGKTYTMEGDIKVEENKGIILHAFDHIFAHISKEKNKSFLVHASFLQIYMEDVTDLLGDPKKKLHIRQIQEEPIRVLGLSEHIVKNPQETVQVLENGKKNRKTGETSMNRESSRSHSIFTITVEQQDSDGLVRVGKLNLVDLAGSERLAKTNATGQTAKEGAKINQSLLALGNVISALVTGSKHIAYRDSKLTQLLQDSLGGNSKTVMVATIGPADYNYEETYSTLMYATRARDIKNKPKINEDPKDALLGQLKAQIEALKKQLEERNAGTAGDGIYVGDNEYLKEIEAQHQKQLQAIMAEKNVNEEQRQKMKEALDQEYEKQKQTKAESEELKNKIQIMENSVLVGGVNLVDKAKQQEEEIRANESKKRQLQEEQRRLEEQKKQQEEQMLLVEKKSKSLKEEYTSKIQQIKKIRPMIKEMEESIEDIQKQYVREKEEQTTQINTLDIQLKLLKKIAESFIPNDQIELIMKHCRYDESNQKCTIDNMDKAGCHRKVEEIQEEESIFIQGIDGAVMGGRKSTPTAEMVQKKAEIQKKRQRAAHRMLNEFALSDSLEQKINN